MVAPHAGAWIETPLVCPWFALSTSPPMRGRGLKHRELQVLHAPDGRPPCGGVD